MLRQASQDAVVGFGVDATEINADTPGAIVEGGVAQMTDQAGNIRLRQVARVQADG